MQLKLKVFPVTGVKILYFVLFRNLFFTNRPLMRPFKKKGPKTRRFRTPRRGPKGRRAPLAPCAVDRHITLRRLRPL